MNQDEAGGGENRAADLDARLAEARALLEANRQARVQACWTEVREVLQRHGFRLEAVADLALFPTQDPAS